MDDHPDPISQFFPDVDPAEVDLYAVLSLTATAAQPDVKKAYRKLALVHHPDKHATAADDAHKAAVVRFQQIGFAYAVLGDEKRREKYDKTGRTDEGVDFGPGEDGWDAYFEELFESVTKEKLDEMKKEYQGSQEEADDLKQAYTEHDGSIEQIMAHIPHSTFDDEARFIVKISALIQSGELPKLKTWDKSVKDEKAKLVRKKQGEKEATEAEELAKELGVWDEFYGSGKPAAKKTRKGKAASRSQDADEDEEDTSALQALILKKRKNMDSFFDGLASKYAEPEKGKGKKRRGKAAAEDEDEAMDADGPPPKKRAKRNNVPPPPDIDDEEFEKLQQKLFPKDKPTSSSSSTSKTRKGKKAAAR